MAAMVPELNKAKMADAEAAADLWWEDPEAAGKMYGGAVSIMKSHIANIPALRRERNRVREARELGEARKVLILETAKADALERNRLMQEQVKSRQAAASGAGADFKHKYRDVVGAVPEHVLQELARQETGAGATSITNDRWVAKARLGDDHSIRNAVQIDMRAQERTVYDDGGVPRTVESGSIRYGLYDDPERKKRAEALWGENGAASQAKSAEDILDSLHIDLQLLEREKEAIMAGDAAPTAESRVSVTQRRPMGGGGLRGGTPITGRDPDKPAATRRTRDYKEGKVVGTKQYTKELEYRPEAIYGTQKGWGYTGGVGSEIEVQPLGSGGSLSFRMEGIDQDATSFLNAPGYWSSKSTAAVRGEIVESSVYLNRPDPEVPRPTRRGGPKMPPGTQDQINYLAKRYEAAPYKMPPAQAQAEAQLLAHHDPDAFHRALRSAPPKGGGGDRVTGPLEAGGGAAPIDTDVYPEDWMRGAIGGGLRRVNETPMEKGGETGTWVHSRTGVEFSEADIRNKFK